LVFTALWRASAGEYVPVVVDVAPVAVVEFVTSGLNGEVKVGVVPDGVSSNAVSSARLVPCGYTIGGLVEPSNVPYWKNGAMKIVDPCIKSPVSFTASGPTSFITRLTVGDITCG
jgi:hypothetical protein